MPSNATSASGSFAIEAMGTRTNIKALPKIVAPFESFMVDILNGIEGLSNTVRVVTTDYNSAAQLAYGFLLSKSGKKSKSMGSVFIKVKLEKAENDGRAQYFELTPAPEQKVVPSSLQAAINYATTALQDLSILTQIVDSQQDAANQQAIAETAMEMLAGMEDGVREEKTVSFNEARSILKLETVYHLDGLFTIANYPMYIAGTDASVYGVGPLAHYLVHLSKTTAEMAPADAAVQTDIDAKSTPIPEGAPSSGAVKPSDGGAFWDLPSSDRGAVMAGGAGQIV